MWNHVHKKQIALTNLLRIEGALAMIRSIYDRFFELCDIAIVGEKRHFMVRCMSGMLGL